MISEVLLVLAGHSSSLFQQDQKLHPAFSPLLHPGEAQCLEALGTIAFRYRAVKEASARLGLSSSRFVCALCVTLQQILRDEYESLLIQTEARVLRRDSSLVASGSFVPISSIRATFSEWDAPLVALQSLMEHVDSQEHWAPGPLIDMLQQRAHTGVHRVASIMSRLSVAVQRVWRAQLVALILHGSIASKDPLALPDFKLADGAVPACVSAQTSDSISYIGRAVGTVKAARWQKQLPRDLVAEYTDQLETVLPQDQHSFDRVIADIRTSVSEWLWLNVLTREDVGEAVDALANYFLLRSGEFALSLIREIEQLKISRLTARSGPTTMIREQDLHLAMLRSSLGTTAQQDPALANLRFRLPSGPLRPLLPSYPSARNLSISAGEITTFDDLLLGTPLMLTYAVTWPLDLFLQPTDLQIYAALFSYISSLRKTHTRIHTCWTSLSNAQRARRRWTGLDEGGTSEDLQSRKELLRCGWGVLRKMCFVLDVLLGYVMTDVVDVEFRRFKSKLANPSEPEGRFRTVTNPGRNSPEQGRQSQRTPDINKAEQEPPGDGHPKDSVSSHLDFTTLRNIHSVYLQRLLAGSLLSNPMLTAIIRPILQACERFVAQVERWGGDVLPALLFEGSVAASAEGGGVGAMVKERWGVVAEINETLHSLLESLYEQLSLSTSQQPFGAGVDASKSVLMNMTAANVTGAYNATFMRKGGKGSDGETDVRRHVERLLLRLDFNGGFSKPNATSATDGGGQILPEGGLA